MASTLAAICPISDLAALRMQREGSCDVTNDAADTDSLNNLDESASKHCQLQTAVVPTVASEETATEASERREPVHPKKWRVAMGQAQPPIELYPQSKDLPWHFSWVDDGMLGGMSAPTDRVHYPALLQEGVGLIVNVTEDHIAPLTRANGNYSRNGCVQCHFVSSIECDTDLLCDIKACHGLDSLFIPVHDGCVPSYEQLQVFLTHAREYIAQGLKVVVHCQAGVGRTGVFLAVFIMEKYQCSAQEAIDRLRSERPQSMQFHPDDWYTEPFRLWNSSVFRRNYIQERFIYRYHQDVMETRVPQPSNASPIAEKLDQLGFMPPSSSRELDRKHSASSSTEGSVRTDDTCPELGDDGASISHATTRSTSFSTVIGDDCDAQDSLLATQCKQVSLQLSASTSLLSLDSDCEAGLEPTDDGASAYSYEGHSIPDTVDLDLVDAEVDLILDHLLERRSHQGDFVRYPEIYQSDSVCHLCRGVASIGPVRLCGPDVSPTISSALIQSAGHCMDYELTSGRASISQESIMDMTLDTTSSNISMLDMLPMISELCI
ncbi:hypothetical protein BASA50_004755 [Batrachochytrium salamandrivorans]|uniref:Protein-tyrosine-phosphatase n=1 Tax=Batrachochytrium salamandrivorans TaxID=1357716 RepID=A0ABQ8FEP5_9FUNG|nr:hypothetical protein BASA62_005444 [Batrachochytrium salamandrivorans]KAH6596997.1 hypothetical protein BASA50_004755 [Batrachochytrium salamandrivorans]KAH9245252.1 hypothetical protein BASA81_017279 [Batrachochytrium salamandrivorans]KAJ1345428.1 hypothetical protein BSLG_000941 [Batrachochytrium salamandrivorans]